MIVRTDNDQVGNAVRIPVGHPGPGLHPNLDGDAVGGQQTGVVKLRLGNVVEEQVDPAFSIAHQQIRRAVAVPVGKKRRCVTFNINLPAIGLERNEFGKTWKPGMTAIKGQQNFTRGRADDKVGAQVLIPIHDNRPSREPLRMLLLIFAPSSGTLRTIRGDVLAHEKTFLL